MHVALLTGGGDCPGLNAVIRAVTRALINEAGVQVSGIEQGFLGLIEDRIRPLDAHAVRGIVARGGTILGTHNKANPFNYYRAGGADVSDRVLATLARHGIDAVVAIGGDGTMAGAHGLSQLGVRFVGVPKTIDNDLMHTDRTFGFDSAVSVVAEAIERLETTASSHRRVMIVETMGRYAGWIALEAGLAGGADVILLPELPYDLGAVAAHCRAREADPGYTIVCVAEGALPIGGKMTVAATVPDSPDPIRLGGIGNVLREQLQPLIGSEVRTTLLGHVQRGGSPTAFDRVLATRFGHHAARMVLRGEFDRMVVLRGECCDSVPLVDVAGLNRTVPADHPLLAATRALGVSLGQPA